MRSTVLAATPQPPPQPPQRTARRRRGRRTVTATLTALALAVLAGCSPGGSATTDGSATSGGTGTVPSGPTGTGAASPGPASSGGAGPADVYLSLGDSYGAGYRPLPQGGFGTTRDGFAYRLTAALADAGNPVELVNLACSGATTQDMRSSNGCDPNLLGPGAPRYSTPQLGAALELIRQRPGAVKLITLVIGGNDFQPCFTGAVSAMGAASSASAVPSDVEATAQRCLDEKLAAMSTNLADIVGQLRAAAGPDVTIVGLTYPDVFLGVYPSGNRAVATASISVFRDQINPRLQRAYAAADARFVDLTAAFGGYQPMGNTQPVEGIGTLPVPVARICTLTFACSQQDVHPQPAGHQLIADQIQQALAG